MSFSQEMKDFLGAYKTGQSINASKTDQEYKDALTDAQKKKTERENDPETLELESKTAQAKLRAVNESIASSAARRSLIPAQAANLAASGDLTRARIDAIKAANAPTSNIDPSLIGGGGIAVPAIPDAYAYAGGGAIPDAEDDDVRRRGTDALRRRFEANERTRSKLFPRGNSVELGMASSAHIEDDLDADRKGVDRKYHQRIFYANGGAIPDAADAEDDDDEDDALPAAATPTAGTSAATDFSARSRNPAAVPSGLAGVVSPQLVHDAARAGYRYTERLVRSNPANAKAVAQGVGGLNPQELALVKQRIDPEGKLTEAQRNMLALGAAYQHYANRGDGEKAEKVAFQVLQTYRNATQRYAAIAAHAAEQGNMDLATQAAVKAYAHVPDAKDMSLSTTPDGKILYHYTDENGKTITKGLATPQELASSAMGLARGGFDQAIMTAAGQREEAAKGTSGGNKQGSVRGGAATEKLISGDGGPMAGIMDEYKKKTGKDMPAEIARPLTDTGVHILQQNSDLTPHEAISAASTLLTPNAKDPAKTPFKTISENGINTIEFDDGKKIKLNDDQFNVVLNQRAQARKQMEAAQDEEGRKVAKPGLGDRVGAVLSAHRAAADENAARERPVGTVFPGGAAPAPDTTAEPDPYENRPYVPVLANRRRGAIPSQ